MATLWWLEFWHWPVWLKIFFVVFLVVKYLHEVLHLHDRDWLSVFLHLLHQLLLSFGLPCSGSPSSRDLCLNLPFAMLRCSPLVNYKKKKSTPGKWVNFYNNRIGLGTTRWSKPTVYPFRAIRWTISTSNNWKRLPFSISSAERPPFLPKKRHSPSIVSRARAFRKKTHKNSWLISSCWNILALHYHFRHWLRNENKPMDGIPIVMWAYELWYSDIKKWEKVCFYTADSFWENDILKTNLFISNMSFSGDNYEDKFLADLVDFVANDKFQSMFESFFLEHATKFSTDEERK